MSSELPLFPLNVVLFPGMQLPLHIFEQRYRLMMQRCLDGDRCFGVAMITEGQEGESGTVPASTGCSCEIVESTTLPDGRMNLVVQGRRRFRILTMREEDDYLIGAVEWIDDEPAGDRSDELAVEVKTLLTGYLASLAHNTELTNLGLEEIDIPDDPYSLSMWVAALIAIPNEQKQQLLVLETTEERLDLEYQILFRSAIVQRAYEKRGPDTTSPEDETGPFAQFASLN